MTERALTAEERAEVEHVAGLMDHGVACASRNGEQCNCQLLALRAWATARVRENGDLQARCDALDRKARNNGAAAAVLAKELWEKAEAALARLRDLERVVLDLWHAGDIKVSSIRGLERLEAQVSRALSAGSPSGEPAGEEKP